MNCQFCFTGRFVYFLWKTIAFLLVSTNSMFASIFCDLYRMGLRKHLSVAEIVDQAVLLLDCEFGSLTNVVFMVSILRALTV